MRFKLPPIQGLNTLPDLPNVGPQFLTVAENVDITVAGTVLRRAGYRQVLPVPIDAFWTDGENCLVQSGSTLLRVTKTELLWQTTTIASDLAPVVSGKRMSGVTAQGKTFWTTGSDQGVVIGNTLLPFGVDEPSPPLLQDVVGSLPPGRYLTAITYLRSDGRESAPSTMDLIEVAMGGVQFTLPASPSASVVSVNVYLSTADGTDLYHAGVVDNGTATFQVVNAWGIDYGRPMPDIAYQSPPQADFLGLFNGRLLLASGDLLFWSALADFERFNQGTDFLQFDGPITAVAAVADALYVATATTTWRYSGGFPLDTQRDRVGNGCIPGTMTKTHVNGVDELFWYAPDGVCRAVPGAPAANLTGDKLPNPLAASGCGGVVVDGNEIRFLANLSPAIPTISGAAIMKSLTNAGNLTVQVMTGSQLFQSLTNAGSLT